MVLRVAIVLLALLPCVPSWTVASDRPPDIVVVITDDMRADDWTILADTRRLVGGTWFPNFIYNTPLCCPFRASLQRGQMAHNTGIRQNGDGPSFGRLADDTIATALHDAGYHTAYVGKYVNQYNDRAPGWDDWRVRTDPDETTSRYWEGKSYITDAITADAEAAVAAAPGDAPLFLMIGHVAPHAPWQPAPRYAKADVGPTRNRDDADRKRTLLSVDDSVEAVTAAMGTRWDTACVIIASDNGYVLGEHGNHGKSIWWDQVQRVPLLVRCPGIAAGTDPRLASTVDLAATILRAAGASVHHPLDGRPLQESWQRNGVLIESWDIANSGERRLPYRGIKGDGWVYVEPKGKSPRYYQLRDGETVNHYTDLAPNERQRLAAWLDALRSCAGATCWGTDAA